MPGNVAISGPTFVCTSKSSTYTISNLPSGATVSWSSSSNLQLQGGNTGNPKTFTPVAGGGGPGQINATIILNAESKALPSYPVTVSGSFLEGKYLENGIYIWKTLMTVNRVTKNDISVQISCPGVTSFQWSLNTNGLYVPWTASSNGTAMSFKMPSGKSITFMVSYSEGSCGTVIRNFAFQNTSSAYSAYPNPVADIVNVEFDQKNVFSMESVLPSITDAKALPKVSSYDIRLYDSQGNMLRRTKSKGEKVEFNVRNLPNGVYYLHVYDGSNDAPEIRQIVVSH